MIVINEINEDKGGEDEDEDIDGEKIIMMITGMHIWAYAYNEKKLRLGDYEDDDDGGLGAYGHMV